MTAIAAEISSRKRIALVAHDNKKQDLLEWARYNRDLLAHHELLATFVISSPLMSSSYQRALPDYEGFRERLHRRPGER